MMAQKKISTLSLKERLLRVNERISDLMKVRSRNNDIRMQEDIDRLRELRVIVEHEINRRECLDFLKINENN